MKTASIHEIKQELLTLPPREVLELCLRIVKYKKENKELLTYLLFEAHDEAGYVENVKKEIEESFSDVPRSGMYQAKKSLRKILRSLSKYSKHTASKQAEVEMLLHFSKTLKSSGIPIHRSTSLTNLYNQQIKKINSVIALLHEDLRYDYTKQVEELSQ